MLYPPRPKSNIRPNQLSDYENKHQWVAQRKFNGTRTLIHVDDTTVKLWTRHGTVHKQFQLTASIKREILSLNFESGKEYWLDGELLHNKTKSPSYKSKIILFDVLHAGRYLFSKPNQIDRLEILCNICNYPTELEPINGIALQITENIWMAETWRDSFKFHFDEFITHDEIEGLVLRKKNSSITNAGSSPYDVSWMIRCRKPHSGGIYSY